MHAPLHPIALAQLVARNLVPVAGILFFGWPALNVLMLYLLDTVLMMTVIFAGAMRGFFPPPEDEGWAARANAEVGYVGMSLVLSAMILVPLAVPLVFMTGGEFAGIKGAFADPTFRTGALIQFGTMLWSWLELRAALATRTPDELRLKRRFALVFLRWMMLVVIAYTGIGLLFGSYGALVFVVIYAATSIVIDIAPDRFLRALPGGAEDATLLPGGTKAANGTTRRKRR